VPFKESTRNWWMRVADDKCVYEIYTEEDGFQDCGRPAEHVHHIIPEGWLLALGEEPEHSVGMPLCAAHHVKGQK
jgi:hypothetical protein